MSQKCCAKAHFGGLTGPALCDVFLDDIYGIKVSVSRFEFLKENILAIAVFLCRFGHCASPAVATYYFRIEFFFGNC